jgi:hypothetical protein
MLRPGRSDKLSGFGGELSGLARELFRRTQYPGCRGSGFAHAMTDIRDGVGDFVRAIRSLLHIADNFLDGHPCSSVLLMFRLLFLPYSRFPMWGA